MKRHLGHLIVVSCLVTIACGIQFRWSSPGKQTRQVDPARLTVMGVRIGTAPVHAAKTQRDGLFMYCGNNGLVETVQGHSIELDGHILLMRGDSEETTFRLLGAPTTDDLPDLGPTCTLGGVRILTYERLGLRVMTKGTDESHGRERRVFTLTLWEPE